MKRRVATILLFLLAGAVVNVAVALGCTCWSDRYAETDDPWPGRYLRLPDPHTLAGGSARWKHVSGEKMSRTSILQTSCPIGGV